MALNKTVTYDLAPFDIDGEDKEVLVEVEVLSY